MRFSTATGLTKSCDSSKFEGQWRGNVKHGKGIQVFEDGAVYTGEWANGIRMGAGKMTNSHARRTGRNGQP